MNRKTAAAFLAATAAVAAGVGLLKWKGVIPPFRSSEKYAAEVFAMDAPCVMIKYGDSDFSALKKRISELDGMLSAYDENGELFRLNTEKHAVLSDECARLLDGAAGLYRQYGKVNPALGELIELWNVNGDDPSVPSDEKILDALKTADIRNISLDGNDCTLLNGARVNFGAVGKGFALDEISKVLDSEGTQCAIISFGSSSLLYGEKPDGEVFKVSIADPENDSETMAVFDCEEGFVSTSGGYERFFEADGKRYIHIFDESSGYPVETDLTSVTVICSEGMLSDFLSTRIFIGGTEELDRWLSDESIQLIAADTEGNVYCSDSIRDSTELKSGGFKFKDRP